MHTQTTRTSTRRYTHIPLELQPWHNGSSSRPSSSSRLTDPGRFGASSLHQRDARSQLFAGYNAPGGSPSARSSPSGGYGLGTGGNPYASPAGAQRPSPSQSPYPGSTGAAGGFRSATPNRKGQYSDAVLNELESQNDEQVAGILGKVRVLKDVSTTRPRQAGRQAGKRG